MHISFVRAVCSKENACALGDFIGPLVHSNIKHAHSNHPLHIFSTSTAGSKVERYTETAEQMVWICRVLLVCVCYHHILKSLLISVNLKVLQAGIASSLTCV